MTGKAEQTKLSELDRYVLECIVKLLRLIASEIEKLCAR